MTFYHIQINIHTSILFNNLKSKIIANWWNKIFILIENVRKISHYSMQSLFWWNRLLLILTLKWQLDTIINREKQWFWILIYWFYIYVKKCSKYPDISGIMFNTIKILHLFLNITIEILKYVFIHLLYISWFSQYL